MAQSRDAEKARELMASALILSAGYSSRMHAFKPLLPFGGACLLELVIGKFIRAGIEDIVVVYGHNRGEMEARLKGLPVIPVENPDYASGMFSSVLAGLKKVEELNCRAFFVTPVDYPLIRPSTPAALIDKLAQTEMDIIYPVYRGKRGHPVLIRSRLIPHILGHDGEKGLYGALLKVSDSSVEAESDDPGILMDMDTEDDYRFLLERFEREKSLY